MARNASFFIGSAIRGLSWVDVLYLYDDHSNDDTVDKARQTSQPKLVIERGIDPKPAFERGELAARNYVVRRAFDECNCDVLILADSDELFSSSLRAVICETFSDPHLDSLCLSTWHLHDTKQYIHCWETHMNGVYMVDPHIRVIRRGRVYEGAYADGSHPYIRTTDFTRCIHGPHHFHLKYYCKSPLPNYALNFLPKYPSRADVRPYLRSLPFPLPPDVRRHLREVSWGTVYRTDADYYGTYQCIRVAQTPQQVLTHPRDRKKPPC